MLDKWLIFDEVLRFFSDGILLWIKRLFYDLIFSDFMRLGG